MGKTGHTNVTLIGFQIEMQYAASDTRETDWTTNNISEIVTQQLGYLKLINHGF